MRLAKYAVAVTELLLIFPASLFMTALFVRNLQPSQLEPAHTAQQIVDWYARRPGTGLWLLLVALPLTVLLMGFITLVRHWRDDAELRQAARHVGALVSRYLAPLLIATSTLAAGGILAIVALHLLSD